MNIKSERRESFFICEEYWFDGDRSGNRKTRAVSLGHLTLTEVFEIFESAVDRRVANHYESLSPDYPEYIGEDITLKNQQFFLNELSKIASEEINSILSFESLGLSLESKDERQKSFLLDLRNSICESIKYMVAMHFEKYPIRPTEIDSQLKTKLCEFLEHTSLLHHIYGQPHALYAIPVQEKEKKDNTELTNQFLKAIGSLKPRINEYFELIKARLLQKNSQMPSLCFSSNDSMGGYQSSVTYKIVCRGLAFPEPNWIDFRLKDTAFRQRYPSIYETLIKNEFEAVTDDEIFAKALSTTAQ